MRVRLLVPLVCFDNRNYTNVWVFMLDSHSPVVRVELFIAYAPCRLPRGLLVMALPSTNAARKFRSCP